ncbi:MAG TPA: rhodanese-like domain-containing protein [Acholeplasmataceae bacterium]|jgi:rhodanese-related sulfurtransferase|nr:rhodanese-like domain-containing protein [Acholeplasmataceae bacterium]
MGVKNISAIELTESLKTEKVPIIDIRPPGEYNLGHIPGAINIVLGELLGSPEKYIKPNKRYYIICEEGKKSIGLCYELGRMGYDVVNVLGGILAYRGPLNKNLNP